MATTGIINNTTGFVLVSHTTIPEVTMTLYGLGFKRKRRTVETRVYEAHVSDDAVVPSIAVNPGRLSPVGFQKDGKYTTSLYWVCESMELTRGYGHPLSGVYREVWTYKSKWVDDED